MYQHHEYAWFNPIKFYTYGFCTSKPDGRWFYVVASLALRLRFTNLRTSKIILLHFPEEILSHTSPSHNIFPFDSTNKCWVVGSDEYVQQKLHNLIPMKRLQLSKSHLARSICGHTFIEWTQTQQIHKQTNQPINQPTTQLPNPPTNWPTDQMLYVFLLLQWRPCNDRKWNVELRQSHDPSGQRLASLDGTDTGGCAWKNQELERRFVWGDKLRFRPMKALFMTTSFIVLSHCESGVPILVGKEQSVGWDLLGW